MGYRIFLKGKKPIVVDSLAEAQRLTELSIKDPAPVDATTPVNYETLPDVAKRNKIDGHMGHLNEPVHITDPDELVAKPPEDAKTLAPVEVTVTEADFVNTCPDPVNVIRVSGSNVPPDKSAFKEPKK